MTNPQMNWDIRARDRSKPAFRSFDRNVDRSERGVYRLGSSMERASNFTNRLAAGAAALAGLGVAARAVRNIVEESSRLAKNADKVGLLTDEFQRLQFGFGLAGVEAASFTTAMEQFNRRLTEAQSGTGNLKKILDANNISLFDSQGNMKSVNQLLSEYAELIKNAESSQNKLFLATEAFGRSGGDMVLALRNGADGIRELVKKAKQSGVVIEEHLLRRAEQFDDDWTKASRSFEVNMNRAVLTAVDAFYELDSAIDRVEKRLGNFGNADIFRDINKFLGIDPNAKVFIPDDGIVDNPALSPEGKTSRLEGEPAIFNPLRFNSPPQKTTIPKPPGERQSGFEKVIAGLRLEQELLGKTAQQQREINALRAAGVDASSERGQMILAEVEQYNRKEVALRALEEQQAALEQQQLAFADSVNYLGDIGLHAFEIWAGGADDMSEALKRLAIQLAAVGAKGLLLGQGPLAGLFGGGLNFFDGGGFGGFGGSTGAGGQLAAATSGAFAGLFADGGQIGAGQWGIVGEAGAEIVSGPAAVTPLGDVVGPALMPGGHGERGGGRQTIDIRIATDTGLIADVADQRIEAASGDIINVSVERARRVAASDAAGNIIRARRDRTAL